MGEIVLIFLLIIFVLLGCLFVLSKKYTYLREDLHFAQNNRDLVDAQNKDLRNKHNKIKATTSILNKEIEKLKEENERFRRELRKGMDL